MAEKSQHRKDFDSWSEKKKEINDREPLNFDEGEI